MGAFGNVNTTKKNACVLARTKSLQHSYFSKLGNIVVDHVGRFGDVFESPLKRSKIRTLFGICVLQHGLHEHLIAWDSLHRFDQQRAEGESKPGASDCAALFDSQLERSVAFLEVVHHVIDASQLVQRVQEQSKPTQSV